MGTDGSSSPSFPGLITPRLLSLCLASPEVARNAGKKVTGFCKTPVQSSSNAIFNERRDYQIKMCFHSEKTESDSLNCTNLVFVR